MTSPYQMVRSALEMQHSKIHAEREQARNTGSIDEYLRQDQRMKDHRAASDWFYNLARFFKEADV